jgi:hypothetical protein
MSESGDEPEPKPEAELSRPAWLLGGKLAAHYKRVRDERARNFISLSAKVASMSEEGLLQRIADGDSFADVFHSAIRRAIEDGDAVVLDVLARLVAAALHDARRIHEISYILTKLEKFKPLHLRIITALPYNASRGEAEMRHFTLSTTVIAEVVHTNELLIELAMSELTHAGFVAEGAHHGHHYEYYLDWVGAFFRHLIGEFSTQP